MTYCLALRTHAGLVFAADTRTHAGVDYVTSYRKLHVFEPAPDRIFVLAAAGSLATTQELVSWVRRDLDAGDDRVTLNTCRYPFEAAQYLGRVSRDVQDLHAPALTASGVSGEVTLILGARIAGHAHQLFLIYTQGNFVEASEDTPYLQIGENKYGKPILDRLAGPELSLGDAARLCVASLDATIRSNLTVGLPLDLAVLPAGATRLAVESRLDERSAFYREARRIWQEGIEDIFRRLPRFPWEEASTAAVPGAPRGPA